MASRVRGTKPVLKPFEKIVSLNVSSPCVVLCCVALRCIDFAILFKSVSCCFTFTAFSESYLPRQFSVSTAFRFQFIFLTCFASAAQKDEEEDEIEPKRAKISEDEENLNVTHSVEEQHDEKSVPDMEEDLESDNQPSNALPMCNFFVLITTGKHLNTDIAADSQVLEMQWLDGQNKNDLYQLFQYLQNKITCGL